MVQQHCPLKVQSRGFMSCSTASTFLSVVDTYDTSRSNQNILTLTNIQNLMFHFSVPIVTRNCLDLYLLQCENLLFSYGYIS